MGGVDRGSISEKGGRYAPEFLWNTNWKDQLELEQARPAIVSTRVRRCQACARLGRSRLSKSSNSESVTTQAVQGYILGACEPTVVGSLSLCH